MTLGRTVLALMLATIIIAGARLAHADELSDLRANIVLLRQMIDQARTLNGAVPSPAAQDGGSSLQGSFPRSFRIPGTDTELWVGGKLIASVYDSLER